MAVPLLTTSITPSDCIANIPCNVRYSVEKILNIYMCMYTSVYAEYLISK